MGRLAHGTAGRVHVGQLKPLAEDHRRVSFYLDRTRGFVEWRPLAMAGERAWLVLEPGYEVCGDPEVSGSLAKLR